MGKMNTINSNSIADIEFKLKWKSTDATHNDSSLVMVNFWRDILPEPVAQSLLGTGKNEEKYFYFDPGDLVDPFDPRKQISIAHENFDKSRALPAFGRFYPKGVLKGLYNVFPQNMSPVRCTGVGEENVKIDLNHPLAPFSLELTARVHEIYEKPFDRGGQCRELKNEIATGPGMQARCQGQPTDFFKNNPFGRTDETGDELFYKKPRFVNHLDQRAIDTISEIYGRFISPDTEVLDLMSSWCSHVPASSCPRKMTGLGMNSEELAENPQLSDYIVYDLNKSPRLPFEDNSFDTIICTASVEYLTKPFEIFKDAARILRPGGMMIHTFSNRWFPPKAISLWSRLHEFERMGLVAEYFHKSGGFCDLATYSSRGWDRPETDKYFPDQAQSDPVFAVWASVLT
jgi:hypothetical protein